MNFKSPSIVWADMIETSKGLLILLSSILTLSIFSYLSFSFCKSSIIFYSLVFLDIDYYLEVWFSPNADDEFYFYNRFLLEVAALLTIDLPLDLVAIFGGFHFISGIHIKMSNNPVPLKQKIHSDIQSFIQNLEITLYF